MKTTIKFISLLLILHTVSLLNPDKTYSQTVRVNFQVFYDELSPYGTWINSPEYGYVWMPNVAPGFSPYATNGYWVFTNEGWTWVSDYAWGWAPFHYGRWYSDPMYGPLWVPDNQWGPGWVTWRRSGGYYGWAPIGPRITLMVAYGNNYYVPYNHWRFVKEHDFGRTNINNYYINTSNNITIIKNSKVINNSHTDKTHNVTYNTGPDRVEAEKNAGRKFTPVDIKESSKPGQHLNNNQLEIYRPQVQKDKDNGLKSAPKKATEMKVTKPQKKPTQPTQKEEQPAVKKSNQNKQDNPNTKQKVSKQPAEQTKPKQESHPQKKADAPQQQANPHENGSGKNPPHVAYGN